MIINNLNLRNFRVFKNDTFNFSPNINLIVGKNGTGKTSIVEAIYLLGITKSHRSKSDTDMIMFNEKFLKVSAKFNKNDRNNNLEFIINELGKNVKLNSVEQKKLSDYLGYLNVIMFAPEDLDLIKGNPKIRRKFLDIEIGQASKKYLFESLKYKKLLKNRNKVLKTMDLNTTDHTYIDVITSQLIDCNIIISKLRRRFIDKLNVLVNVIYKKISSDNENIELRYKSNLSDDKEFQVKAYKSKINLDILNNNTSLGCHKDDIEFYINNKEAKFFSSQGQQRTIVLSVKLGLIDLIKELKNDIPILILDDVLSELDDTRRRNLFRFIENNVQTFITSTSVFEINKDNENVLIINTT